MLLSKKIKQELYAVIYEEITNLRIKLKLSQAADLELFKLELAIWEKQKQVLERKRLK